MEVLAREFAAVAGIIHAAEEANWRKTLLGAGERQAGDGLAGQPTKEGSVLVSANPDRFHIHKFVNPVAG